MLVIDDNKLKLVKMHEALLKVDALNRNETLKKYRDIVVLIDEQAFSDILREIEQISEHNQSLEDELQFLERIKESYDQLIELQFSFKKVYESYSGDSLDLSDLSQLNIEYIENRINVINGYLINLKNIDENTVRLQELSQSLVEEEKKRVSLSKRLLELETLLRDNFLGAEGRDAKLQPVSVISEYSKLGFDFRRLLTDSVALEQSLSTLNSERVDIEEKLRAAEICYNTSPNADSRQILSDIRKDFLNVRYRLAMVKIIDLLAQSYDDYDAFKEKRENLLSLIKYRISCLEDLGIRFSVDPFGRTKVGEQLQMLLSLADNSKNVSRIRKEIAQLDERTEEMRSQNSQYLKSLSETKTLLENKTSINDIDVSLVDLEEVVVSEAKPVEDNQVVSVRSIPMQFNMRIAKQKTSHVMRRVNGMIGEVRNNVEPIQKKLIVNPQLVILPKVVQNRPNEDKSQTQLFSDLGVSFDDDSTPKKVSLEETSSMGTDIFATVEPFESAPMFIDRADESFEIETSVSDSLSTEELATLNVDDNPPLEFRYSVEEEKMPEAFWVTQEENDIDEEEEMTFDDQINVLLSGDNGVVKSRKKSL